MFQKNVNPKASSSCDRMQEMLNHSHITKQRNNSELMSERGRASYFAVLSVNCLCILFLPWKLQTLLNTLRKTDWKDGSWYFIHTHLTHILCQLCIYFLWRSHWRKQAASVNHTTLNLILFHCVILADYLKFVCILRQAHEGFTFTGKKCFFHYTSYEVK